MALEREFATFKRELPRLLQENLRGKYVLIHGDDLDSVWATRKEALDAGYDRFGLDAFCVKEITDKEKQVFFPRLLIPNASNHKTTD